MASNYSHTSNTSQEVEDHPTKATNWFVKAYILRGRNDKYSEFYDRNREHIKFFVKHVISDIELEKRIVDDPDENEIKNDVKALADAAQQKLEKFKYTHVMLIFSVYGGSIKQFRCRENDLIFEDIREIMDQSNILKKMNKVIIVDAFGGNGFEPVQALGPTRTSIGHEGALPDGMNLLKYCGLLKNYDENMFLIGSLFLRVVFHELLIQSSEQHSINLNVVFDECTRKLTNDYDNETVERIIIEKTGQVEDPLIQLNLGDTIRNDIKAQYVFD